MSFFAGWKGWRRYRKLSWDRRNLVFYSESAHDWHHFAGLIDRLNGHHGLKTCYVSSDPADPGLRREHVNHLGIYIPEGLFLTLFFQFDRSDVFVLTMMDLDNLQLKRSTYPVHYVYIFHSLGNTHMADRADSLDHYDTIFCAGPQHVGEIRKREKLAGLPAKDLFEYGYPRLEALIEQARNAQKTAEPGESPTVLVAPTWGEQSLLNVCGRELIDVLLAAGYEVIMRPHYQTTRKWPEVVAALRAAFEGRPRFEYVDRMGESESILRSDVLVSDWSAMSLEYALGLEKPVLSVDVPRRVRNPDWRKLGMEPVESAIRGEAGEILAPDALEGAPAAIQRLLEDPDHFGRRMRELRERLVFRLGHSVPDGAAELARLAEERRVARSKRAATAANRA